MTIIDIFIEKESIERIEYCLNFYGCSKRADRCWLCPAFENFMESNLNENIRENIAIVKEEHRLSCFYQSLYFLSAAIILVQRTN